MPLRVVLRLLALAGAAIAADVFAYRTYAEMVATMKTLNETSPGLVDLFVAQDRYGLPYPPELQCEEENAPAPCKQYVLRITNESTLQKDRPQVFFSGALHGDERVGPQATIELALLLASYAHAYVAEPSDDANVLSTQEWIWRLVNTRAIYLMPMTNAFGYFQHTREENGIDPNRDYNYKVNGHCMEAMTSRAVNEVWRDHLFQLAMTFHGGMRCVTYEWGSPNHMTSGRSERSPDDTSQVQLGDALARFAGPFPDGTYYPTGTMNDVVYGVYGGMEDWAYAASWENALAAEPVFTPCTPSQYGGYPAEKTVYNNATHRAFNILVETSNAKQPSASSLGAKRAIYGADLQDLAIAPEGHVPQNIRLGLLLIDMVQPYVRWLATTSEWNRVAAPPAGLGDVAVDCLGGDDCLVSAATTHLRVGWEVLGSFQVDATFVQVSSDPEFPASKTQTYPSHQGRTRRGFYVHAETPPSASQNASNGPFFMDYISLPINATATGALYVRVAAMVDQGWATQAHPSPHVRPQSHLVNARTDPSYEATSNGYRIRGHTYFYSTTKAVRVTEDQATSVVAREGLTTAALTPSVVAAIGLISLVVVVALAVVLAKRRRPRKAKKPQYQPTSGSEADAIQKELDEAAASPTTDVSV
ncbi:hypothetical protein SPRG_16465 [Saprolegnia parasitica CBS 223.65]|uniref:Peptidase M14 domain-containing protein n=1 Tax=Saprolegnia parasitica (strain CBS 223.65) TaxID=695850 RepID=A0A067BIB4_SAPPC|nr:hypothetical protein SPRG_16465 [Saprolegnia parasitica CBS 223.65]KDO18139.1 hypothetical protein SPRG_16465 [Saprolegnia parasitica CBS 223.65]|eukprot:XP_012211154.1 hypothetical protein SPRG_16465 [Saprolegnia parasitica CBS 223.65]